MIIGRKIGWWGGTGRDDPFCDEMEQLEAGERGLIDRCVFVMIHD